MENILFLLMPYPSFSANSCGEGDPALYFSVLLSDGLAPTGMGPLPSWTSSFILTAHQSDSAGWGQKEIFWGSCAVSLAQTAPSGKITTICSNL